MLTLKWQHRLATSWYMFMCSLFDSVQTYNFGLLEIWLREMNICATRFHQTKLDHYRRSCNTYSYLYNKNKPWWYPKAPTLSSMSQKKISAQQRQILDQYH